METLWKQLNDLFPETLPPNPEAAINGTRLFEKVRDRLEGYSEKSIRQHFSIMSQDPSSSIAKKADGHGYYLRKPEVAEQAAAPEAPPSTETAEGREAQLEEKFRAIFMRHSELSNLFPMPIDHTRATKISAGINRWKFPDVVLLRWEVSKVTDQEYEIDPDLLEAKKSLGEQLFSLESVELKIGLSTSTFRENFFQCVSNSKWAHKASLIVANNIDETMLRDELRRLGSSYDVSVISYGLATEVIELLPNSLEILKMTDADFEKKISGKINETRISSGKERDTLDWGYIRNLRSLSPEFRSLFEWVNSCASKGKIISFQGFQKIREIERQKTYSRNAASGA